LAFLIKHFSAYKRELEKMRNYFIFVNLFCFSRKVASSHQFQMQLASQEDKIIGLMIQLLEKLLKENYFALLQTFIILLTFFSNIYVSLDKKLLSHLSALPKEDFAKFTNQEMRKLGVILLTNNMPRTSSFFFYKPRKEVRRIKFFTYFDCCKRLVAIKANNNKKPSADGLSDELKRRSLV